MSPRAHAALIRDALTERWGAGKKRNYLSLSHVIFQRITSKSQKISQSEQKRSPEARSKTREQGLPFSSWHTEKGFFDGLACAKKRT